MTTLGGDANELAATRNKQLTINAFFLAICLVDLAVNRKSYAGFNNSVQK